MAESGVNPDGTSTIIPDPGAGVLYRPTLEPLNPDRRIPSLYVAQLAVAQLLESITARVKDDEKVAANQLAPTRAVKLKKIFIDWPPNEAELTPAQATIMEVDEQGFGDEIMASRYLEDTKDKYGKGTIVYRHSLSDVRLAIHMIFGHRDDRRAFRAELEDWQTEPLTDRAGRKVVVPYYFDAQVLLQLMSLQNLDDGDKAQRNLFTLIAGVTARVPVLRLVTSPQLMRPRVMVETT